MIFVICFINDEIYAWDPPTTTEDPNVKSCEEGPSGLTICGECKVTIESGEPVYLSGCGCGAGIFFHWIVTATQNPDMSYTYTVDCAEGTTTTTTTTDASTSTNNDGTTTTIPGVTTTTPVGFTTVPGAITTTPLGATTTTASGGGGNSTDDYDEDEEEDEPLVYTGPCNITALDNSKRNITKIFFYVASIWVILWTVITIITNIVCKQTGHHRFLGLFEELAIIVLWVFLGYFVWDPFEEEVSFNF